MRGTARLDPGATGVLRRIMHVVGTGSRLEPETRKLNGFARRGRPDRRGGPGTDPVEVTDTNANGKIDHVTATFSEPLSAYTAANVPWALTGVPSGGTLASVAMVTPIATLTLTQGAGPADTSVGSFTVAMSANATGIRDAAGNLASFAATAPTDKASPVATIITTANTAAGTLTATIRLF